MMNNRLDLTDWVVHFVHEKKPESIWTDEDGNQLTKPVAYDERGRSIFTSHQEYRDDDQVWEMSPYEVLLQIIADGYLQTTWSERGRHGYDMRPTVYGPRSAVCFTEMPLHALIEYQSQRAVSGYVAKYAIALKRNEFFENGGRPVIYGLTGEHAEATEGDPHHNRSARNLASTCGISLMEQYRYVAMKLGGKYLVDWSHEREWRWTKNYTRDSSLPGLPLWTEELDAENFQAFSEIVLITETEEESLEVIDVLKNLHDVGYNNFGVKYSKRSLKKTKVTSFETLKTGDIKKIDDIAFSNLNSLRKIRISKSILARASEAIELAMQAAKEQVLKVKRSKNYEHGSCGRAYVVTYESHNEYVQALVELGHASPRSRTGYVISVNDYAATGQSMDLAYHGARSAQEVLEHELGLSCFAEEQID